ncbi:hypothetical protein [Pendulispora albinea]|uniref:Uncharacterized protein n=1 Tax=Pendulispora albinea TaxID=2741071 RepID=A0ABZ2M948_9BACT
MDRLRRGKLFYDNLTVEATSSFTKVKSRLLDIPASSSPSFPASLLLLPLRLLSRSADIHRLLARFFERCSPAPDPIVTPSMTSTSIGERRGMAAIVVIANAMRTSACRLRGDVLRASVGALLRICARDNVIFVDGRAVPVRKARPAHGGDV